jgi:hypothetical protein
MTCYGEQEFLNQIDDEIKRTEDSIKVVDDRYGKLKSPPQIPVYSTSLFKKPVEAKPTKHIVLT